MIRAYFDVEDNHVVAFKLKGHSGSAEKGRDIICASVSAMTMLTINTIEDIYNQKSAHEINDTQAYIDFRLCGEYDDNYKYSAKLLESLYLQIDALAKQYPKNVAVSITKK